MRKIIISLTIFTLLIVGMLHYALVAPVYADPPTSQQSLSIADGEWIPDSDVTFLGKTVSRAQSFVDWALNNYQWVNTNDSTATNALANFWTQIRNITYALLLVVILIAAFTIIITRGKSLSALVFARKFVIMLILITFSFALMQFLYQITDVIMSFFVYVSAPTRHLITSQDLLSISFQYGDFKGFRRYGQEYDESAFVSLLLIRLTAIVYYIMATVLLVRKVILWFFIAVSPIYPLILIYFPIRNTAKVWIGEFLRWLLYGPLFYVFLNALVVLWSKGINIINTNYNPTNSPQYETAINILLGGPGQHISYSNSLSTTGSFAQYIVALIMLALVVFLPFVLLQMFLDFVTKVSFENNPTFGNFANTIRNLPGGNLLFAGKNAAAPNVVGTNIVNSVGYNRPGIIKSVSVSGAHTSAPILGNAARTSVPSQGSPRTETNETNAVGNSIAASVGSTIGKTIKDTSSSSATSLPHAVQGLQVPKTQAQPTISNQKTAGITATNPTTTSTIVQKTITQTTSPTRPRLKADVVQRESYHTMNFSIPTLRDIAKYEMHKSNPEQVRYEAQVVTALRKIGDPIKISSTTEKDQYTQMRTKLTDGQAKNDPLAISILSAANAASGNIKELQGLPLDNKIQSVQQEDFEAVKSMWEDNYRNLPVPQIEGKPQKTREEWIEEEKAKVTDEIQLLVSGDQQKVEEGMKKISDILPFILVGGFSKNEVSYYLQAKLAAAEAVLKELVGS